MKLIHYILALSAASHVSAEEEDFTEEIDFSPVSVADALTGGSGLGTTYTLSTDADFLISDDINVQRYSADFKVDFGKTNLGLTYRRSEYDLDISGASFFSRNRTEDNDQLSLSLGQEWNDRFPSGLTLAGYKGFTSHRSIWITEAFETLSGGAQGFKEPNPFGFSASLSNTFTLPNDFDTISIAVGYSRDRVAPAQTIESGSLDVPPFFFVRAARTDDTIDTVSVNVTGNFYITNKITSEWFARAAWITNRDVRTQLRLRTAWNVVGGLTLRGEFGATFEQPEFEAFFGGVTLTYQLIDSLSVSLGYRLYSDTGDISSPGLASSGGVAGFSSAAPPLDSNEVSLSFFWSQGAHSANASVAYLQSDFGSIPAGSELFEGVFEDRDFLAVRAAYTYEF